MTKPKRKDFEIRFYESLVKNNPRFRQAFSCLGDAYTRKGFYAEGRAVDERLVSLDPDDPTVHYNLACSLSLLGDIDGAFGALKKAVLLGYDDYAYILDDPDLDNLRRDGRFKDFLSKLKKLR
ncbi:MAG: tetratricopeptide repeat protein [Candidatus Omnitrophota bacterium]